MQQKPIVIAGAGSIGCYVGGLLAAAGKPVVLLARERVAAAIGAAGGLHLSDLEEMSVDVPMGRLRFVTDPADIPAADVVLMCVKSPDTAAMAALLADHMDRNTPIVSLQNGIGNLAEIARFFPEASTFAGIVPFNVVSLGGGRFHRATSGEIAIDVRAAGLLKCLNNALLPIWTTHAMERLQWGKLLVSLNNALNALSGVPLQEQLRQRNWRLLLARQVREALRALEAAKIRPISSTGVPPRLMAPILCSPDAVFRRISPVKVDRHARSSMWDDLCRGRKTEVDYLQGAVIDLAMRHGLTAPVCASIRRLVEDAERAGQGSPALSAENCLALVDNRPPSDTA